MHVVTEWLEDLSPLLRSVGQRGEAFPVPIGQGTGRNSGAQTSGTLRGRT